jgi:hypothetical protein
MTLRSRSPREDGQLRLFRKREPVPPLQIDSSVPTTATDRLPAGGERSLQEEVAQVAQQNVGLTSAWAGRSRHSSSPGTAGTWFVPEPHDVADD